MQEASVADIRELRGQNELLQLSEAAKERKRHIIHGFSMRGLAVHVQDLQSAEGWDAVDVVQRHLGR
jgi:hypothetical protein